ncbi:MAG: hypothetical protein EHM91_01125 [Planctomycetota bacterium]|nr:MAG: hypothetical protein EHM91_01125 [Planctomycetota bacterium]
MIPLILVLLCAQAQEKDPAKTQDPKVQDRLEDQDDRIKDLERRLAEMEKKQAQTTSANPATVLNPRITVAGDFLWRFDDRKVFVDNDPAEPVISDTINVREVELDLRASVDPYVDGVAILAVESESPGEFEITVEEFYGVIKSLPLPFWETPPLGTKIKVGRFRTEFGLNNKLHMHDLPQSDRPLVVEEFLGFEGQVANGVSTQSFLPSPGDTALELTLQVLNGGSAPIADETNRLSYLANLNFYVPLADEHSLNVAAIGFYGVNDHSLGHQDRVAGLDLLYKWKPARMGEYQSFLFGGQLFYASHEFADALGAGQRSHPFGYFLFAQYQVSARLYAGLRWDQTEVLTDDTTWRRKISPYLTWYTTEFFRARFTYEHTFSELPGENRLDSFFVEMVIIFGAHPPEPFWVNK